MLDMPHIRDYIPSMANVSPVRFDTAFSMRAEAEFFQKLDEIRRRRDPIPTRAEVVRELVDREYEAPAKKRKRAP